MSKNAERKGSFKSISGDDLKDFYSSSNNEKNYNIEARARWSLEENNDAR